MLIPSAVYFQCPSFVKTAVKRVALHVSNSIFVCEGCSTFVESIVAGSRERSIDLATSPKRQKSSDAPTGDRDRLRNSTQSRNVSKGHLLTGYWMIGLGLNILKKVVGNEERVKGGDYYRERCGCAVISRAAYLHTIFSHGRASFIFNPFAVLNRTKTEMSLWEK